jgi:hypothetical protein
VESKKRFVELRGLAKLHLIKAQPGSMLKESIDVIFGLYPQEIVQYYSPGYDKILLSKITDE